MFFTRLLSGIVLIILTILAFFFGGIWLYAAFMLLSVIGAFELMKAFGLQKSGYAIVAYIDIVILFALKYFSKDEWLLALFAFSIIVFLMVLVARYPKDEIKVVPVALFSVMYVGFMLSFVCQTRSITNGIWLVWLIILGSWASDTCAYVTGMLFGKHHFSELSPKKTIEGCIGGVVGSGILSFVFSLFFPYKNMFFVNHTIVFVVICVVCAVISQFGDLAASAIKRKCNIKDYGNIIPGHGGVLDRFDSVIFVAPIVYYLLKLSMYLA